MIDPEFLAILACPKCHAPLREEKNELMCTAAACGLAYRIEDEIPQLIIEEARDPKAATRGPSTP